MLAQLASLDRKRGRSAEAERRAREALAGAEQVGDRDLLAHCHLQLGLVEKDRDNLEAARRHLTRALELARQAGTRQTLARVHVSLADLALRTAIRRAERTRPRRGDGSRRLGDRFTLAKLLSVEARMAGARDEVEPAERLFAEGVRLSRSWKPPYEHARSLYEWGLHLERGHSPAPPAPGPRRLRAAGRRDRVAAGQRRPSTASASTSASPPAAGSTPSSPKS